MATSLSVAIHWSAKDTYIQKNWPISRAIFLGVGVATRGGQTHATFNIADNL